MRQRDAHHWFVMLLVLAFMLGLSAQGFRMNGVQQQTMAGMGNGSMPGDCPQSDGCADAAMDCAITCAGLVSLSTDPANIAFIASALPIFARAKSPGGRDSAPEPYPPRSSLPG